jgi:hypothetical protein
LKSITLQNCPNLDIAALPDVEMYKVSHLDISRNNKVCDQFLEDISTRFPNLTFLNLSDCRDISDDGLVNLSNSLCFTGLQSLILNGCDRLSDFGVAEALEKLVYRPAKLNSLSLSFCIKLTDNVIDVLTQIPSLLHLELAGCSGFTRVGLTRLKSSHLEISTF